MSKFLCQNSIMASMIGLILSNDISASYLHFSASPGLQGKLKTSVNIVLRNTLTATPFNISSLTVVSTLLLSSKLYTQSPVLHPISRCLWGFCINFHLSQQGSLPL